MAENQFDEFIKALKEDEALQSRILSAPDLETAVAIANEAGYTITIVDWMRRQAQETMELTDDQLLQITGGMKKGGKIALGVVGGYFGVTWAIAAIPYLLLVK